MLILLNPTGIVPAKENIKKYVNSFLPNLVLSWDEFE